MDGQGPLEPEAPTIPSQSSKNLWIKILANGIAGIISFFILVFLWRSCHYRTTQPKLVLLVVFDSLRADRLAAYGGKLGLTPNIDKIASSGLVFEHAVAPSSWTVPSMASIFLGLYPTRHGIVSATLNPATKTIQKSHFIPSEYVTLAEGMRQAGYATFGCETSGFINPQAGWDQGFDIFEFRPWAGGDWITKQISALADMIKNENRAFVFLHYTDPHYPYYFHPDSVAVRTSELPPELQSIGQIPFFELPKRKDLGPNTPGLKAFEMLYNGEIEFADREFGKVLDILKPDQFSLIAILADHGESFQEHGKLIHGETLFEEILSVPLILQLPKRIASKKYPQKFAQHVSLVDIYPTLMGAVNGVPPNPTDGANLLALVKRSYSSDRIIFSDLVLPDYEKIAAYSKNFKYQLTLPEKQKFLIDLSQDPSESANLAESQKSTAFSIDNAVQDHLSNPVVWNPVLKEAK